MDERRGRTVQHQAQPPATPGTGPEPALALRGLTKRFGGKVAVDALDLDVPAGSFFGVVGPNGAGKTTTLSMATGLLRPDAGRAFVLGADLWADPIAGKRRLGVLPDGVRLFDRLTGLELVRYAGLLRGMPRDVVEQRASELLDALGLADAGSTLVVDYSAGMTKKVALACALVHAPRLLVLDEPFEAVDPVSGATIRTLLTSYVAGGGTVVLSSHVMDLVERMCDHVAVISAGRVLATGALDAVRGSGTLEERFVDLVGGGRDLTGSLDWLR
ncbi:ABC transporter ATP-binding protein [Kineococcus esterisolvens]|uniref:ABC transporter ATP-binding protein n=1 Tax=unclassified Kineococcus TaxID=2621656 RepID=UPI003D7DA23C